MWAEVQRTEHSVNSKCPNTLYRNVSSIFASTSYQLPTLLTLLSNKLYTHAQMQMVLNFEHLPHPSQQANSSCIESLCNVLAPLKRRYYRIIKTGMKPATSSCFTKGLVAHLAWPMSARHFAPCAQNATTMFVHTVLLFWPILSIQRAHRFFPAGNDMD